MTRPTRRLGDRPRCQAARQVPVMLTGIRPVPGPPPTRKDSLR